MSTFDLNNLAIKIASSQMCVSVCVTRCMPWFWKDDAIPTNNRQDGDVFRLQSVSSVQKGSARTTNYGITCFTVCALVFGGATLRDSDNANGCRTSEFGRQLQHAERPSWSTTRTGLSVGPTPVTFVFWNHGPESPQSNSSAVSRSTADGHGGEQSQVTASYHGTKVNRSGVLRRALLWDHNAPVNDALWEAPVRNFGNISIASSFLMEIDKGCPQPPVFDDSTFGEYLGALVQNEDSALVPALITNVNAVVE